eukprot:s215_g5.t1
MTCDEFRMWKGMIQMGAGTSGNIVSQAVFEPERGREEHVLGTLGQVFLFGAVLAVLKCRQRFKDDERFREEKTATVWVFGSIEVIVFYDSHDKTIHFGGLRMLIPAFADNVDALVALGSYFCEPSGYSEDPPFAQSEKKERLEIQLHCNLNGSSGGRVRGRKSERLMLEPEKDEGDVLKRVGLSVLSNTSYWQRSRKEASDAEQQLAQLRREAQLRQARCEGQLENLARDAKEEQERRLISDKISKELASLRQELQRKDEQEEERLRHLYRGILGPAKGEAPLSSSAMVEDLRSKQTPLIFSEAKLLSDDVPGASLRLPGDGLRVSMPKKARPGALDGPAPFVTSQRGERGGRASEADKLLRVNLARLERLERFGL